MLSGDCLTVVMVGGSTCALIHAGWRGLVAGIVGRGVEVMGGDEPKWVFLAPAIGPCCYEVGEDVAGCVEERFGPAAVVRPSPRPSRDSICGSAPPSPWRRAGVSRERVLNPFQGCALCATTTCSTHIGRMGRKQVGIRRWCGLRLRSRRRNGAISRSNTEER